MTTKRFVHILLAVIMILSLSTDVFASDSFCSASEITPRSIQEIGRTIAFEYYDSDSEINGCIDINNLCLGSKIMVYETTNTGIISSDVYAYPLFSNNSLFAIAFLADGCTQLDEQIAKELIAADLSVDDIILIYDNKSLSAFDGQMCTCLHEYSEIADRIPVSNFSTEDLLKKYSLDRNNNVDLIPVEVAAAPNSINSSSSVYLSVGIYHQSAGSTICWACSAVCIGNYKKPSYSTSPTTFANYVGTTSSLDIGSVIPKLNSYYSLNYAIYGNIPSMSWIKGYLDAGSPIYGRFGYQGNLTDGHAMVIRGADLVYGYISLMDPDSTTYQTASYYYSGSTLTFRYYNSTNNTYWVLTDAGYPN